MSRVDAVLILTARGFLLLLLGGAIQWVAVSPGAQPAARLGRAVAYLLNWAVPLAVFAYLGHRGRPWSAWHGAAAGAIASIAALVAGPALLAFGMTLNTEMGRMQRALWYQGSVLPQLMERIRFATVIIGIGAVIAVLVARRWAPASRDGAAVEHGRAAAVSPRTARAWRLAGGVLAALPILTAAFYLSAPRLFPIHGALTGTDRPLVSLPGAPAAPDLERAARDLMLQQEIQYQVHGFRYTTRLGDLDFARSDVRATLAWAGNNGWAGHVIDTADAERWCGIVVGDVPDDIAHAVTRNVEIKRNLACPPEG